MLSHGRLGPLDGPSPTSKVHINPCHRPDRLASRLSCRLGGVGGVLGEELGVVLELFPDLWVVVSSCFAWTK
jgi:hypothetical protein